MASIVLCNRESTCLPSAQEDQKDDMKDIGAKRGGIDQG